MLNKLRPRPTAHCKSSAAFVSHWLDITLAAAPCAGDIVVHALSQWAGLMHGPPCSHAPLTGVSFAWSREQWAEEGRGPFNNKSGPCTCRDRSRNQSIGVLKRLPSARRQVVVNSAGARAAFLAGRSEIHPAVPSTRHAGTGSFPAARPEVGSRMAALACVCMGLQIPMHCCYMTCHAAAATYACNSCSSSLTNLYDASSGAGAGVNPVYPIPFCCTVAQSTQLRAATPWSCSWGQ